MTESNCEGGGLFAMGSTLEFTNSAATHLVLGFVTCFLVFCCTGLCLTYSCLSKYFCMSSVHLCFGLVR